MMYDFHLSETKGMYYNSKSWIYYLIEFLNLMKENMFVEHDCL